MNQARFIIAVATTAVMMMMMTAGATATAAAVQAMEISDKPSSMEILNLINQYNRDNPQQPIVCSSGFVFPQHDSGSHSSGSSTSIATQIGHAIDDAVGEVQQDHVTGSSSSGDGGNHHENSIANEEQMREMITHTSTPVPTVNSGDSDDGDDNSDDNGNAGEEGDDNGGGSSVGGVETEDSGSD